MATNLIEQDAPRLLEEAEFVNSLNSSPAAVAKAVAKGDLFVVMQSGQRMFPSFFADKSLNRRQLVSVSKLLGDLDGFTKWYFFISGKGSLGGLTPLAALRQGLLRQVKVTARGQAER